MNTSGWRTARACNVGGCVAVQAVDTGAGIVVEVTDTKNPGPVLRYTRDEWEAFLHGALLGEFDIETLLGGTA